MPGIVMVLGLLISGCLVQQDPPVRSTAVLLKGKEGEVQGSVVSGWRLKDIYPASGINFAFSIAGSRPLTILQSIGNGAAFFDYNRDGNLDILLVGGPSPRLYCGNGKGHFTDVTVACGLQIPLPKTPGAAWHGCAIGDIDNDGFPDIYLSGYRTAALLHNCGGKRFVDITREAGLPMEPWGTSCAFVDLDGDGFLDLVVGNYARFSPDPTRYQQYCNLGVKTGCGPLTYQPELPSLYRNRDGRHFQNISVSSGFRKSAGKCLGVAIADYDADGRPDILLANDMTYGNLYHNLGHGLLRECGEAAGVANGLTGLPHGGMGVDWGDYDNDGRLDAVVTTFENEPTSLYRNNGEGTFTDMTNRAQLGAPSSAWVGFGVKWIDIDNDGWLDLITANGHVYDNADQLRLGRGSGQYRQPVQVFRNLGGTPVTFTEVSALCGPDLAGRRLVGRGLAIGDFDNDGRTDVLIVDAEGPPMLIHNETQPSGNWIGFRLIGGKRMNRDAYGAQLVVTSGRRHWTRQCQTCGSYLSASDPRVHFGLGNVSGPVALAVRWPNGKQESWNEVPTGRYLTLRPGKPPY